MLSHLSLYPTLCEGWVPRKVVTGSTSFGHLDVWLDVALQNGYMLAFLPKVGESLCPCPHSCLVLGDLYFLLF